MPFIVGNHKVGPAFGTKAQGRDGDPDNARGFVSLHTDPRRTFVKKRLALVLAGAAAMSTLGMLAAQADGVVHVNTPIGTLDADPSTGIIADGASTNPAPLDGYLIVDQNGVVTCGDGTADQPFDDAGVANPEFVSSGTCNPSVPPPPVG
jgi:hypothetical protein